MHLTSLDVNGLPSCHFTPCSSWNVSVVLALSHDQLLPISGTIVSRFASSFVWSNSTRLLKTGMNGNTVEIVASSWIEALGGVSHT